jgi:stage II sporulation protein P
VKVYKILYVCSLLALVAAGMLFVNATDQSRIVGVIDSLKDKTIVFYSSNYDRSYTGYRNEAYRCMDMMCIEGMSFIRGGGLNSIHFKIEENVGDPYTQSSAYLKRNLKSTGAYVLIDISRDKSMHGSKYDIGGKLSSPITIKIAKKSQNYDNSLLFIGRVKAVIDEKYKSLPVQIITLDDGQDYNQSLGCIGMIVEFGDSANTYDEAREALNIFCRAIIQVDSIGR